jgi:hypothetical protein
MHVPFGATCTVGLQAPATVVTIVNCDAFVPVTDSAGPATLVVPTLRTVMFAVGGGFVPTVTLPKFWLVGVTLKEDAARPTPLSEAVATGGLAVPRLRDAALVPAEVGEKATRRPHVAPGASEVTDAQVGGLAPLVCSANCPASAPAITAAGGAPAVLPVFVSVTFTAALDPTFTLPSEIGDGLSENDTTDATAFPVIAAVAAGGVLDPTLKEADFAPAVVGAKASCTLHVPPTGRAEVGEQDPAPPG